VQECCALQENREAKETEEEQKGKMKKAKERKGPLRGHSRLPGNALPRKLMPVKERGFEYRSKSTKTPDRGFISSCE